MREQRKREPPSSLLHAAERASASGAIDPDQTASEADRTASDADRIGAERDDADAASDQRAADQDQLSADRQRPLDTDVAALEAYEGSRVARAATTIRRSATRVTRARTALSRIETSAIRDAAATIRDRTARRRDDRAAEIERSIAASDAPSAEKLEQMRTGATAERAYAAADRRAAAGDRAMATHERVDLEADRSKVERDRECLAAIVEQAADGIVVVDAKLRITYANAAFAGHAGRAPSELVGRSVFEVVDGTLDAPTVAKLREVTRSGQPWLGEVERRLADGTVGPVQIGVTPWRAADGRLEGYVVVSRDVTELRQSQAAGARLAAAVEQAADYVIVNDQDGIVQAVNPALERVTGHRAAEVLGRPVAGLLRSGVDPPEVYAALDAAIARGDTWTGRLLERRADGSLLEVDLSVSPIRDAAGDLIGSVEIGRDRTRERELEAEHEREAHIRVALAESLAHIPQDATLEQMAQSICDELVRLPFVDVAGIEIFLNAEGVEMLAVAALPGYPAIVGTRLPAAGAARVRERTTRGPWAGYVTDDPADGFIPGVHAAGLRALAYEPIVHRDHVGGVLVFGTFDERFAHTLVEQMPGLVSFGTTASALLGERMHAGREQRDLRHALEDVLFARAFHPVFQPIVDLALGETVGYEALTRFDSGQRPDLCFTDAWSVGLGQDIELATLEAAVTAAKRLPPGLWLDLNVSPRLLADSDRLREVLWSADRPLVIEITEHEVIEDYDAVRAELRALGHDIRLAVDDAGAGVANFGHIIDLRPDFVKLDMSLVRRVNANLGRQAMVVGMRHFSRTAGCRLVAEGIETEDEARTLSGLGVEFGQGYLFGHPERVEAWAGAELAGRQAESREANTHTPLVDVT